MATLLNDCGCCEGVTAIVPAEVFNRPGLPHVRYRAGTHCEFLASALAALSDPQFTALRALTSRDTDDFTIALLDSWAVLADVLTFYQERIANESYLRTATERQSILELARLIGYTLRPGVAASTYLAFTLEDAPGAPKRTTIEIGTKAQSVPGPGEQPQIFETIEAIDARAEWNALKPQATALFIPKAGDKATYLQGVATNLKPGDALLFVGMERESDPKNENWDFRLLKNVEPDEENGRTLVTWEEGLGDSPHTAPAANPRVYALRQRSAVFGYNAPEWRTIPDTTKALYLGLDDPRELIDEVLINGVPYSEKKEWPNFTILAPSSTPKPQPVPDRVIQPTRESVAAAATAAAAIATQAATDAANDAVQKASDAKVKAEAAVQTAQNTVQPDITAAENTATAAIHSAILGATTAINAATATTEMVTAWDDIVDQANNLVTFLFVPDPITAVADMKWCIGNLKSAGLDDPNGFLPPHLGSAKATIDGELKAIADAIKTTAKTAINGAEPAINTAAKQAAQAAVSTLNKLITAAQTFATTARDAAAAALVAAAVTQTAVIIATLIKAVLELPETLRPPDANTMAIVIDAIADLAAEFTTGGVMFLTNSLPGLNSEANKAVSGVAGGIKATNLGSSVKPDVEKVKKAVKAAVAAALKPVKIPRPARRDIFEPYQDTIDLDMVYQKITPESWLVLSVPTCQELYKVTRVVEASRAEFSVTAKTTRVTLEGENLKDKFEKAVRITTVFAQSEELEIVETPLDEPLYGARIAFSQLSPDLKPKQALAVTGKRAQVSVTAKSVQWVSADSSKSVVLQRGEVLSVMAFPRLVSGSGGQSVALTPEQLVAVLASSTPQLIQWQLMDRDGSTGFVTAASNLLQLHAAAKDDPTVTEIVFIGTPAGAVVSNHERTIITLREPLLNCYDRATVMICANLGAATHGETKNEVLGSGDASQLSQEFVLKQSPLTYIRSTSPSGTDSTLQVRVNDVLWHERPTLYGRGPCERIFSTRTDDAGTTTVEFGDGLTGARLPTGNENVKATYRKGVGLSGNVKAGQLSLLMSRPLGVKAVTNPLAAEGADEPESFAKARQNAPRTILTFDRVVSLQDYEDFTRGYAGIAKALATWTWDGRTRGVSITVAGPLSAAISDALAQDLITTIHDAGDPFIPVKVKSYHEVHFKLAGKIKLDPDYEAEKVVTAASDALRKEFSFDNRNFGQPVVLSEVIALLQNVAGVVAVDLDSLYRTGQPAKWNSRLEADLPNGGDPASLGPAELLTLDPAPIDLEAMP